MLTVDTDASAGPDSGSVQCRHVAGSSVVVEARVGVAKTVARCITHTLLRGSCTTVTITEDSRLLKAQGAKARTKDSNIVLVDQEPKSKTLSSLCTFARDAVAERLLVVERETDIAVASCRIAATDALVRPGRVAANAVDVMTVTRTFRHHHQIAHRVVLLCNDNNAHPYTV